MSIHLSPKRRVASPRKAARRSRPSALVRLADQLAAALLRIASLETRVGELERANQRPLRDWAPRTPLPRSPYRFPGDDDVLPDWPGRPYQLPEITCEAKG